ncbi:MAG: PAS domain-containing protein, partial [Rhodospirillales bacterium]|nr:PAS domain-containing protein [Rhodospirillales bacterium]
MSVVVPSELFFISHAVAFQAAAPPPWRIQFMTPNIPRLTGYDVEDFLSGQKTLADIIHPLDHGRIGAVFAEDRTPFRIDDVRFLDHGGAERRGGIQGIILRNAEGRPQGLLGWIEEGRSPQADLAAVSAVLDSVDALVTIADMETHDVLFMNSTARAVFGEGLGRKCWQLYQPQLSGPCPFCREHALLDVAGQPLNGVVWEQQSQLTG